MVRASQSEKDLVPISGHQSLEGISSDDEADRVLHRLQKFVGRRTLVERSGQSDGRRSAILFGQRLFRVAGKAVEDVHPTKNKIEIILFEKNDECDETYCLRAIRDIC